MNINWYPGHMAKALREMKERLKMVDFIIELIDSRIPYSSRNHAIKELSQNKISIVVATKYDLADRAISEQWFKHWRKSGDVIIPTILTNSNSRSYVINEIDKLLAKKRERDNSRGIKSRPARALVLGVPNVGKSTFINRLANRKSAKVENRAGVTRSQQLIKATSDLELLDTPGVLWPKLESERIGINLGLTGAIPDNLLPLPELAEKLFLYLRENYHQLLSTRYPVTTNNFTEFLEKMCLNRKLLKSGGNNDLEKAIFIFIKEFRDGILGSITLEKMSDYDG